MRNVRRETQIDFQALCSGDLSQRPHPFSFRTRQLSSVEAMVLLWGRVASRQNIVLELNSKSSSASWQKGFLCA